ncbi:uncharacterized protein sha isoform X2 [Macrobrachium rosenbergii]|uniref:uncharacterized protein sha isoform X2 n=1 Tax=Macrobrachium rosenbergii TaxID=79674 RepID=UPI0034D4C4A0
MIRSMLLLLLLLMWATDGLGDEKLEVTAASVTRHYQGDIYKVKGGGACGCGKGGGTVTLGPGEGGCRCQCPPKMPTFRDDTLTCVGTLDECILADFVSSTGAEKIPYVFMPLKHQLVHPTAEVALLGLQHGGTPLMSPVCVVTKGSILTPDGWKNMANTTTFEPPFRLFRDGGRTYVQWVGEEAARVAAEGRLVMVTLICRDAAKPDTPVFTPCLAFRVAGSPGGAAETAVSAPVRGVGASGLSSSEGVIIGLVVTCLAITYIVAMTIYIKVRRRKRRAHNSKLAEEGLRTHTKGRGGGAGGGGGGTGGGDRRPGRAIPKPSLVSSEDDSDHEDIVDLSMASRARRANRERNGVTFTTAVVHGEGVGRGACHEPSDGLEKAPRSHLAVVETLGEAVGEASEPRPVPIVTPTEGSGAPADIQAAQAKRKLYFNPAYFEPEMLQSPPPAALEFLERIREMITIAKSKMKMKMYQPSLVDIPEEDYEHPSRPMSRSTETCSQITLPIDDQDEEEETKYSSDHSIQSDSLERKPREDDSRSSTLKKLARRVNSQGQSIVSEIIRTLDLKPRLPPVEGMYGSHNQKAQAPKPPPPKPVNARIESPNEPDDDFPELIKPSMLRSVLRDGKRLTDLNNTFENFRQEMMATFNRMKKVGEAISPKSSLSRSKNKNKYEASPDSTVEKNKSGTGNSEGKVQKWLQTLESKNSYTRMSDKQNVVFDSRVGMSQKEGLPPPLPEKNGKPPTLPRKNKPFPQRSTSFHEVKESANSSNDTAKDSVTPSQPLPPRNTVTRSLSWQNEHRHYDSNPRRPRQQVPILPEDSLNTSYGSEDDSLNDLLSEAESKMPKMTPSDSDSTYSDTKPGRRGSLEHKRKDKHEIKSLSRQLPREEEMTARNEIFNKNTGAKTMSRLAKSNDAPYEKIRNGNKMKDDEEDHTYEEIRFPGEGKQRPKRKAPSKPKAKNNISEIQIDKDNRIDDEALYNVYSNPESHISEVTIPETCSSPVYSGCKVTIPVVDNMNNENEVLSSGFDQDTLEKKGRKVQRNGSIIQDSLERPKVKKNDKSESKDNSSLERKKAQRRMSLPGETSKNKDKSLLDIYESRSSNRSIRNYKHVSPERSYSPVKFSNPPSKTPGSFYLSNISSANENNNNNIVNNSDSQKKMRTFKDYQEMKFQRNSSDSEVSSSPLPVTGSSINLNFRSSSPNNKEQKEIRPPLPPKNTRTSDDTSPILPPKGQNVRPPLPQKSNKRYETESDSERPKLPEKSRKKFVTESLSRSSSGGSIPELTEEEARSILHGLLAHTIHDANRLSPLHEEEDTRHFLGLGNTAVDSESQGSVPKLSSYSSGSLESSASSASSSSSPSVTKSDQEGDTLGKAVESSLDHQIVNGYGNMEPPGSPGSEARVSGEFILSTIGRSPSLRRQTSLSREQKSGFLAKLRDMTDDCVEGEHMSKGMEIALALKAKTELEKHFKEKSGADSIKRTWRRIIENADDSKEDKDKISIMQLQQYMASLDRKEKETKLKQEDSGYQSTDSSESGNGKALSTTSTVSTASVGSTRPLAPSRSFSSTSLNNNNKPTFRRSTSLQQLDSTIHYQYSKYEPTFHRAGLLASLDRRHSDSSSTGSSSIYVNNSFSNDDADSGIAPFGSG